MKPCIVCLSFSLCDLYNTEMRWLKIKKNYRHIECFPLCRALFDLKSQDAGRVMTCFATVLVTILLYTWVSEMFPCVSYCAVSIIRRQPVSSLVLLTAILILMAVFVYPRLSGDYLTLRVSRIDTREFHTTVSVVVRLHVHFRSCRN